MGVKKKDDHRRRIAEALETIALRPFPTLDSPSVSRARDTELVYPAAHKHTPDDTAAWGDEQLREHIQTGHGYREDPGPAHLVVFHHDTMHRIGYFGEPEPLFPADPGQERDTEQAMARAWQLTVVDNGGQRHHEHNAELAGGPLLAHLRYRAPAGHGVGGIRPGTPRGELTSYHAALHRKAGDTFPPATGRVFALPDVPCPECGTVGSVMGYMLYYAGSRMQAHTRYACRAWLLKPHAEQADPGRPCDWRGWNVP